MSLIAGVRKSIKSLFNRETKTDVTLDVKFEHFRSGAE